MAKKNNKSDEKETVIKEVETAEIPQKEDVNEDEKSTSEIENLKNEIAQMNDKYLRLVAEYDNFRKRSQKEKDCIYPEAVAATIMQFLPLTDSFDRALACECKDDEFKKGIDMINTTLNEIFAGLKVELIGTVGEKFDPNFHNAVMHEESDEYEESTVVEVFQKGYKIDDKVLRYAMVKVAN
ncbi:MAG: nucleotide exchange factor GrpE [Oscillospiraceae bacterium]